MKVLIPLLILLCSFHAVSADRGAGFSAKQIIQTEARTALVIANSAYAKKPLANAGNDGKAMADVLRRLGFAVTYLENASQDKTLLTLREFGQQLEAKQGVGLVYYAGHGAQYKGSNYLLPVDADIKFDDELKSRSVAASDILEKMESAGNRLNIVIFDACRDEPFASRSRSAQGGLAKMDAPSGTIIAFATAPLKTADDGKGQHSPYTEALLQQIEQPGLKIEDVFKLVRGQVRKATGGQQIPWENTSLEGDFYFVRGSEGQGTIIVQPEQPPVPPTPKASNETIALRVNSSELQLRKIEIFPLYSGEVSDAELEQGMRLEVRSRSIFQQASMLAIKGGNRKSGGINDVVVLQGQFNQQLQSKQLEKASKTLLQVENLDNSSTVKKAGTDAAQLKQQTEHYCEQVKAKIQGFNEPYSSIYNKNCFGIKMALLQGDEEKAQSLFSEAKGRWRAE